MDRNTSNDLCLNLGHYRNHVPARGSLRRRHRQLPNIVGLEPNLAPSHPMLLTLNTQRRVTVLTFLRTHSPSLKSSPLICNVSRLVHQHLSKPRLMTRKGD